MSATETIALSVTTGRAHSDAESAITLEALQGRTLGDIQNETSNPPEDGHQANDVWDSAEGWKVVVAGASIFFVYLGLVYSYGIMQLHFEQKQLANVPTLSFIGSVAVSQASRRFTGSQLARCSWSAGSHPPIDRSFRGAHHQSHRLPNYCNEWKLLAGSG